MKKIKILWVEDNPDFADSICLRIKGNLRNNNIELEQIEKQTNGTHVYNTVRDWEPNLILMDHNLDDSKFNGANLIIEIRFLNAEIPIIYYSSEMNERLTNLVSGEKNIICCVRDSVGDEILGLLSL